MYESDVSSLISTGSGYDAITGSVRRSIVDMQQVAVPGLSSLQLRRNHFITGSSTSRAIVGFGPLWTGRYRVWNGKYVFYSGSGAMISAEILGGSLVPTSYGGHEKFERTTNPDGTLQVTMQRTSGERIAFQSLAVFNGNVDQEFKLIWFEDKYGRRTIAQHTNGDSFVDKLVDPTGRWITLQGTPDIWGGKVTLATSSDGQWVSYSYSTGGCQVTYSDGTSASYSVTTGSSTMTMTFSDVRPCGTMPNARYDLIRRPMQSGGSGGQWIVESVVNPSTSSIVSTREEAPGPNPGEVDIVETRGDGPSRFFGVDDVGAFTYASDFEGNTTQLASTDGLLGFKVDARGNRSDWVRESVFGNITRINFPDGSYRAWTYSNATNPFFVASSRDELGRITTYDRFSSGILGQINFPDGSTEGWSGLNAFLQPTVQRNRSGFNEGLVYNATGQLTRRWLPNATWTDHIDYTYYPDGHVWEDRLWTERDPRGNVTTYEYDLKFVGGVQGTQACSGRGLVTKITHHDGTYQSFAYDIYGNKIWEENEIRQRTSYSYDAYNRLRTKTDALNWTTTYDYTPRPGYSPMTHTNAKPRLVTLPSGKRTKFTYDGNDRLISETVGEGTSDAATTTHAYDAVGNETSITDPMGRVTNFAYDNRNRKTRQYAPLSRTTQWEYDAAGNVTKVINPDSTFTRKEYDSMNRVIHAYDERNQHTGYTYHPSGKVNVITDPRGNAYTHAYDAAARPTSRTYPDGSAEGWSYDPAGNKETETTRSGQILRFYYDNRNREYWRAWDNNAAPFIGTYYDAASRVTDKYNWHGWLAYTFDAAGQVTSERQKIYGPTSTEDGKTETVTFGYDRDGNRTDFGSGAMGLGYVYNNRQQLSAIRYNNDNWTLFEYNAAGQRTSRIMANYTGTDYGYDGAGRLGTVRSYRRTDGSGILQQKFGYDLRDRRTWVVRDDQYGDTWRYQDDSQLIEQRTNVWRPDQNFWNAASFTDGFAYDAAGNRTSWNENGAVTSYAADSCNRYTSITGLSIAHSDGRGNVTQLGGWTFTYDADNHLVRAVGPGHDLWPHYDAAGRLSKIVDNGAFEYRFYDGSQQFWRKRQDNSWIDLTMWGPTPDEVISRYVPGSDWWHNWQFYHQDPLNSVVAVTNIDRVVLERYLYDAFGAADIRDGSWIARSASAIGNRWLFTGQEWFQELGLHNYKARWYSSQIGRFLQNDPVRFDAGDLNLYRYCSNRPSMLVDPLGLRVDVNLFSNERSNGINYRKAASNIPDAPANTVTIAAHGDEETIYKNHRGLTSRDIVKAVKATRKWKNAEQGKGEKITLVKIYACDVGGDGTNETLQAASNELGVDLIAPNTHIWLKPSGWNMIYEPKKSVDKDGNPIEIVDVEKPGHFVPYSPKKEEEKKHDEEHTDRQQDEVLTPE